jgi:Dyp-type peroxidase family
MEISHQLANTISPEKRLKKENEHKEEKVKQPGIGFPAASKQDHLLVIRLDLAPPAEDSKNAVRTGVKRLCGLFERIDQGIHKINVVDNQGNRLVDLSKFSFSATIGFGLGFFKKLDISGNKLPKKLREMPDHNGLGDPTPYSMGQTDLIIQLGSSKDFVNRWVLENSIQPPEDTEDTKNSISPLQRENLETPDIITAITGWATITDVNAGFQRIDGRNLQGFNDGVSNPRRLSELFDKIVWTKTPEDNFKDGTYMVFQKIEHDLDQWRELELDEQQEWVGRSKGTGLLLGTLKEEEDLDLTKKLSDPTVDPKEREKALAELHKHFDPNNPDEDQSNPQSRFFDHKDPNDPNSDPKHGEIPLKCPAWAHVRKANPRQEDSLGKAIGGEFPQKLVFRRGYPYMERGLNEKVRSGLLFVCFQNDIDNGFEFIKKNWFGNKDFPVPGPRTDFTKQEKAKRHSQGRFTVDELNSLTPEQRELLGLKNKDDFDDAITHAKNEDTQNTGREGLAGPSELGVVPTGEFLAIVPFGGGYYFVPPIPKKRIADIGEQFFE